MKYFFFFVFAIGISILYFYFLDMSLMELQGLDVGWNLFPAK